MAYEHHRAFIAVKRLGNHGNMPEINMVCRLVQYKQAGSFQYKACKRNKAFLAFGKRAYFCFQNLGIQ